MTTYDLPTYCAPCYTVTGYGHEAASCIETDHFAFNYPGATEQDRFDALELGDVVTATYSNNHTFTGVVRYDGQWLAVDPNTPTHQTGVRGMCLDSADDPARVESIVRLSDRIPAAYWQPILEPQPEVPVSLLDWLVGSNGEELAIVSSGVLRGPQDETEHRITEALTEDRFTALEAALQYSDEVADDLAERLEQALQRAEAAEKEVESLTERCEVADGECDSLRSTIAALRENVASVSDDRDALRRQVDRLAARASDAERERDALEERNHQHMELQIRMARRLNKIRTALDEEV